MAFVLEVVVPQAPEATVSISPSIPLAPGIIAWVSPCHGGRQLLITRERRLCQGGAWRMMGMRRILEGLDEAERVILRELRTAFPMIKEYPEPLFLLLLVSTSILILGLIRTNWTQLFWENCSLRPP
ncbi:hypothetical protein Fot_42467 [Forsythia ovata]|uniref:Uncharacterized protein n=1 Tax=Forsythia ovata TaxID=205694 RepID=A0ABD1RLA3_9LAMI